MKIKTETLTKGTLDWAVAKCLDMPVSMTVGGWFVFDSDAYPEFCNDYNDNKLQAFSPSTNWAHGGPIIEREKMRVQPFMGKWISYIDTTAAHADGPTPLVAAMRCYVASKLGEEVEVPDELVN